MTIGLKRIFFDLAVQYASPRVFSIACSKEIELIIEKGISKLKDLQEEKKKDKIIKAKESLKLLIEKMGENAARMGRRELIPEDLEYAKEKICPTWPCDGTKNNQSI